MSDAVLENLKKDSGALAAAYRDAGGKGGDGHHHNHCPFCGSDDAFMLGNGANGNAVFACYKAGCKANAKADKRTCGTIVDLVMLARSIDSKAACKFVVERYANSAGSRKDAKTQRTDGGNGTAPAAPGQAVRKQGKLHLTIDDALSAAQFSVECKKKEGGPKYRPGMVKLWKYWKYTDAKGEPLLAVARFNTIRSDNGKADKEYVPVHRDGAGWRVGLGPWGKPGQRTPPYRLAQAVKVLAEAGRSW